MTDRPDGITRTERYLTRLARRSFLRLWSYSGLYRNQGMGVRGEGAELCDLLVVFENDVLIFSDKDCEFPALADTDLAWQRWYRRAIYKSAQQAWGAERWLRLHPDRVFLDRACTRPVPIEIPSGDRAQYHKILVAHDSTGRRKHHIGGSGSLLINPSIVADAHLKSRADGGQPFAVGQIDPDRGYVHVLDDVSLGIVLRTLDTITDFVWYLRKKEAFIASGRLFGAFGEEDLLAFYLKDVNERDEHDFVLPKGAEKILVEEGHWRDFLQRPELQRKLRADRESYLWDEIIDEVGRHALAGTLFHTNHPEVAHQERLLRLLAREPRVRRRMLGRALLERVAAPPPAGKASFRTMLPSFGGDPHYVYVVLTPPNGVKGDTEEYGRYRQQRRNLLAMYVTAAMEHFQDATCVVGIATEGGLAHGRSHDLVMIDRQVWDSGMAADARAMIAEFGWFQNLAFSRGVENEYPDGPPELGRSFVRSTASIGRNDPCPCGSGKKYKKCHGSPTRRP